MNYTLWDTEINNSLPLSSKGLQSEIRVLYGIQIFK